MGIDEPFLVVEFTFINFHLFFCFVLYRRCHMIDATLLHATIIMCSRCHCLNLIFITKIGHIN